MDKKQKKAIGLFLIIVPIIIFLVAAIINGFATTHCWLGSCSTDWFFGVIGIISILIGIAVSIAAKD